MYATSYTKIDISTLIGNYTYIDTFLNIVFISTIPPLLRNYIYSESRNNFCYSLTISGKELIFEPFKELIVHGGGPASSY